MARGAGVGDGVHADVNGVGTIARAAADETVGHVGREEIGHAGTGSGTEVVTTNEQGTAAREVGDVAGIEGQRPVRIGIQGEDGTAGNHTDRTDAAEVHGFHGRRGGIADDLELTALHRDVAQQAASRWRSRCRRGGY